MQIVIARKTKYIVLISLKPVVFHLSLVVIIKCVLSYLIVSSQKWAKNCDRMEDITYCLHNLKKAHMFSSVYCIRLQLLVSRAVLDL